MESLLFFFIIIILLGYIIHQHHEVAILHMTHPTQRSKTKPELADASPDTHSHLRVPIAEAHTHNTHHLTTTVVSSPMSMHVPIIPNYQLRAPLATRGPCEDFKHIGVLTNEDHTQILPLFSKRIWNGSSRLQYATQTDKVVSVFLPVLKNGRDCSAEYGCDELYNGDHVQVLQSGDIYMVTLYNIDGPRYISRI